MTDTPAVTPPIRVTSLADALDGLSATARTAGLDEAAARAEGEALAATIAENARGAFVDWSAQTGRDTSAEAFADAASRGRRYRSARTPLMAGLELAGSPHGPSYARALSDVAMAACSLGEETARSIGNAATAAAAQLGTPAAGSADLTLLNRAGPVAREPVPDVTQHFLGQVMDQLGEVRKQIDEMGLTSTLGGFEAGTERPPRPAERGERAPLPAPPTAAAPPPEAPEVAEPAEPEVPQKSVEELLAELDALVGLTEVKAEIRRQAAVLRVEGLRSEAGLGSLTITRHLIFNGNPGTGKTTVARLVASIYRALGLLSKGQLIEVDRSELVAGFLGQTAMKTAEVVKSAVGGVLFIDEAYSLAGDQYGTEAVDTLVKEMEDRRDDLVIIVAGYPVPMEIFIAQNPGLESRFRTRIDFPDYTDDELVQIFGVLATNAEYDADTAVLDRLRELLGGVQRGPSFGNGRYVRNVLEAAIGRHAWRLRDVERPDLAQLRTLLADDLEAQVPDGPSAPVDWDPEAAPEPAPETTAETPAPPPAAEEHP